MLIQEEIQVGSSEFVDLVITSLLEPLWLLDLGVSLMLPAIERREA